MLDELKNEIAGLSETVKSLEAEQNDLQGLADAASRGKWAALKYALSHARAQLADKLSGLARLEAMNNEQAQAEAERARLEAKRQRLEGELGPALHAEEVRCNALRPEWQAELATVIKAMEERIRAESAERDRLNAEVLKLTAELREAGVGLPQRGGTKDSAERVTLRLVEKALQQLYPWGA